ncbi:MAG: tetratricopeptide repeat protein [Phycisphaerae bacterium]|nr:tetratricopeptide repeat protein [Phycisphaerae bacterium]
MQKQYGPKGVVLVALSPEPASKVAPYVKKNKISYLVGGDAKATTEAYGVRGYPTMFVVDPDGKIAWSGHPQSPDAEEAIKRLLKENPPRASGSLREAAAKAAYKKAARLHKKKQYADAIEAYEEVAKEYKKTEYGKKAKAKLKKLKKNKKIMAKVRNAKAKKDCGHWLRTARNLSAMGKKQEAIEYYERVIREYPKTRYAKTAREEMAKL